MSRQNVSVEKSPLPAGGNEGVVTQENLMTAMLPAWLLMMTLHLGGSAWSWRATPVERRLDARFLTALMVGATLLWLTGAVCIAVSG